MSKYIDETPPDQPRSDPVGYGNPPKKQRFKISGNPDGRPSGAKNRKSVVRQVAEQMHSVTEGGKKVRRTTLELVLLRLRNMALQDKNKQAVAEFDRWLDKCAPPTPNLRAGVLVAPAEISAEEWIARANQGNAIMRENGFHNLAQVSDYQRNQRKKELRDSNGQIV